MIHHDGSSLSNRAYEFIRGHVLSGHFPPGKRLVTRQLAQELGASLNPVREALGRLAAEGLVDHVPGAGASVHQATREEVLELYEFRQAIEPFAASKAARTISEAELAVLNDVCAEQHRAAQSLRDGSGHLEGPALEGWFTGEERFHEVLIRAARNRYFDQAIAHSRVLTQLFHGHRSLGVQVDLRVASRTWLTHSRLVRALRERDADAAANHMLNSLLSGAREAMRASELSARG